MDKTKKNFFARALLLGVACGVAGCAAVAPSTESRAFQERLARDFVYVDLPVVEQSSRASCGAAALSAIGQYWGEPMTEAGLRAQHPPRDPAGYRLKELAAAAEEAGLLAFLVSGEEAPREFLEEQIRRGRPVLVPLMLPQTGDYFETAVPVIESFAWTSALTPGGAQAQRNLVRRHYAVVMGVSETGEERVLLMDPEHGIVPLRWSQFAGYWQRMAHAALLIGR